MLRQNFILFDLEDRALVACDDQYLPVPTAQAILSSWFDRDIPTHEIRAIYARLSELGLLKVFVRTGAVLIALVTGCTGSSPVFGSPELTFRRQTANSFPLLRLTQQLKAVIGG
jgi:hypothetical protein